MYFTIIWISCSISELDESNLGGVGEDWVQKQISCNHSTRDYLC